ncbi:MAG: rhodanese-like domain-containing protein [Bdellovibrionales bacterium]|nr:rhodanese-like domain-containing protein [Bdellovibrionales bacterium]
MNPITMDDLHGLMNKLGPKDKILDVRTAEEFAAGHVPDSKNISHDELEGRTGEVHGIDDLYIYCRGGRRAAFAAVVLNNAGLDKLGIKRLHVVVDGGFPEWENANYPIQK